MLYKRVMTVQSKLTQISGLYYWIMLLTRINHYSQGRAILQHRGPTLGLGEDKWNRWHCSRDLVQVTENLDLSYAIGALTWKY